MQPASSRSNPSGRPLAPPRPPPAAFADDAEATGFDATPTAPVGATMPLRLDAPALFIEARFRGVPLASRLLRADEPRAFAIGNARACDAPVNPAWLPDTGVPEPRRHVFLEPTPGGFVLHLTAAMRPRLETRGQSLPLALDAGRAQMPLVLPAGSFLHVPCGEVTFDIHPAEPAAALPRPWLSPSWRASAKYLIAVALVLGLILLIAHLIPADPRALSLDPTDGNGRLARLVTIPLEVNAPAIDSARALQQSSGGSSAAAAAKPAGQAGDRQARSATGKMAVRGTASPQDARVVAAKIHSNTLLAVLDGPRSSALADVFSDGPAMGSAAMDVLGSLVATNIGAGYGAGGLGALGTGAGGGGEGEGIIGLGTIGTRGRFGDHGGRDYGFGTGTLHPRRPTVPQAFIGDGSVRGTLDKEIIRRIVRRHLNEVQYCYQQGLTTRPSLEGRLVTQFTIAPTGRVMAAVLQSSTLKQSSVESCVVNAIKRWEFPAPDHGGLAIVSYPFTFAPAGQ